MSLFTKHRSILDSAIKAIHERAFFAQYPEHPGAYGEDAAKLGQQAFENLLNRSFDQLLQDKASSSVGEEVSPYTGNKLGITYPSYSAGELISRAQKARKQWKDAGPETRAGLLVEASFN